MKFKTCDWGMPSTGYCRMWMYS